MTIMRSILAGGAGIAALATAVPAAAQYYPYQYNNYAYGNAYGNAYGYNDYNGYGRGNWEQVRGLQVRLNSIERQINRLDRRDRIGDRSADRLRREANNIERRLHERARGGLNPREAGDLINRVQRLEQRVQFAMQSGSRAVFLRFAGCNLWSGREQDRANARCTFCDTDFVGTDGEGGGKFVSAAVLATHVEGLWGRGKEQRLVVVTGGEPMLQLDDALVEALHASVPRSGI